MSTHLDKQRPGGFCLHREALDEGLLRPDNVRMQTTAGDQARTWKAAAADASLACCELDEARRWLTDDARRGSTPPLGAEVWVYDQSLTQVLLVRHRWRGWVPPGGEVERGETPREAAVRETTEETGVRWQPVDGEWSSFFAEDSHRIREHAERLRRQSDVRRDGRGC